VRDHHVLGAQAGGLRDRLELGGGSLQQRYLASGCLTSAPKLLVLGWLIVECWRVL